MGGQYFPRRAHSLPGAPPRATGPARGSGAGGGGKVDVNGPQGGPSPPSPGKGFLQFVRYFFNTLPEWALGGHWGANMTHQCPKAPKRYPKNSLWVPSGTTFDVKMAPLPPCKKNHIYGTFKLNSNSRTTRCRPERKLMPTSVRGWQLNLISMSPLACLVAWSAN